MWNICYCHRDKFKLDTGTLKQREQFSQEHPEAIFLPHQQCALCRHELARLMEMVLNWEWLTLAGGMGIYIK